MKCAALSEALNPSPISQVIALFDALLPSERRYVLDRLANHEERKAEEFRRHVALAASLEDMVRGSIGPNNTTPAEVVR